MKLDISEKDRKLLIFLSIFVIVVCFGYWGIRPSLMKIKDANEKIEQEEEKQYVNEMKVFQLPIMETDNKRLEEDIVKSKEIFYDVMSSDEIDKYFTSMALDYQLYAYSLDININKETVETSPYIYAEIKEDEDEDAYEYEMKSADDTSSDSSSDDSGDFDIDEELREEALTGISIANVSMRLGGDEIQLKKLIDDLSHSKKKLLVSGYSWSESRRMDYSENGEYSVETDRILNIDLEIYMCQESAEDEAIENSEDISGE